MRTLLAPVERHEFIETTLGAALTLARLFDAHVQGVAAPHDLRLLVPTDAFGVVVVADEDPERYETEEAACRDVFERTMARGGARRGESGAPGGPSFGWTSSLARGGDAAVGAFGRVFDAMVLGRPTGRAEGPRMGLLEAALFDSGRPVLIVPPEGCASVGSRVVIDWNGGVETARAVALARPLLARAEAVTVLALEGSRAPEPGGEAVVAHLRRNGVKADGRVLDADEGPRGPALLAEAERLGADLLVKGAYTQSRLRQMIFGGATRHVLAHARMPVLMAH